MNDDDKPNNDTIMKASKEFNTEDAAAQFLNVYDRILKTESERLSKNFRKVEARAGAVLAATVTWNEVAVAVNSAMSLIYPRKIVEKTIKFHINDLQGVLAKLNNKDGGEND